MKKQILIAIMLMSVAYGISADQRGIIQNSDDQIEPTLCSEKYDEVKKQTIEQTIFSCQSGEKIISYCLTTPHGRMTTPDDGYITYRFGKKGELPEMEYPKHKLTIKQAFYFAQIVTDESRKDPKNRFNNISKIENFENKYNLQLPDDKVLDEFSFSVGSYRYTLWLATMSRLDEEMYPKRRPVGLTVEHKGNVVKDFLCDNPNVGSYREIFENQIFQILEPIYSGTYRDKQTEFRGVSPFIRSQQ